jgi:hypothetical protein
VADDRQCCRWLCVGGAGGGLFAAVLYWPLDLEFADMNYTFTAPPPAVGGYRMGELTFNLTKKPLWIHRMGVRLVLGWKWVDA